MRAVGEETVDQVNVPNLPMFSTHLLSERPGPSTHHICTEEDPAPRTEGSQLDYGDFSPFELSRRMAPRARLRPQTTRHRLKSRVPSLLLAVANEWSRRFQLSERAALTIHRSP